MIFFHDNLYASKRETGLGTQMTTRYRDKYLIDDSLTPELRRDLDLAYEVATRINERVNCEGCGVCCHQKRIVILEREIAPIASKLGISEEEFINRYLYRDGDWWFFSNVSPCAFLNKENRCSIQDTKPEICRDAPFMTTQFISAVMFILRYQKRGIILPILGNFIIGDSPCSIKAASIVSEEIAAVLSHEESCHTADSERNITKTEQRATCCSKTNK